MTGEEKGGVERRKRRTVKRSIERECREGVSKGGKSYRGEWSCDW